MGNHSSTHKNEVKASNIIGEVKKPSAGVPISAPRMLNDKLNPDSLLTGSPLLSRSIPDDVVEAPILEDFPKAHARNEEEFFSDSEDQELIPTLIVWREGGKNVFVTGTFNKWSEKVPLQPSLSGNDFSAMIKLPPGTHRLKFIVDDEWQCSSDLTTAADPRNQLVNLIEVKDKTDSFLYSEPTKAPQTPPGIYGDGRYSSLIPEFLLDDSAESNKDFPLTIPPQLTNVLLNSTPVTETDYSTLPHPNHVTLNHMYAQSIRDGVMALGITSRYRDKYITTILYRPVLNQ